MGKENASVPKIVVAVALVLDFPETRTRFIFVPVRILT
jgi:hypothetical protein